LDFFLIRYSFSAKFLLCITLPDMYLLPTFSVDGGVDQTIQIIIECDFFCSLLPGESFLPRIYYRRVDRLVDSRLTEVLNSFQGIQGPRAGDSTEIQEEEHENQVLRYGSTRFSKEWWSGGYRVGYWTHGDASAQRLRFQLAGDAHSQ
jgi:hypothetical protein